MRARLALPFDMRWAIAFLAVGLEVLWAYPWFAWLSHWDVLLWQGPPVTVVGALLLVMGAMLIARLLLESRMGLWGVRAAAMALLALLLALVVRLETGGGYALWDADWGQYALHHLSETMGALALGIYLLWRGISVAREGQTFDDVYLRFVIGLVALIALAIAWRIPVKTSGLGSSIASVGAYALPYFACGLLALALVNLQTIREEMVRQEGASMLFGRQWLMLLLAVVLAIVLVGIGVASGLSLDAAALVLRPLRLLWEWTIVAFTYGIALPLAYVAAGLFYAMRFIINFLRGSNEPQPFQAPDMGGIANQLQTGEGAAVPGWVILTLKVGAIAFVVLVVAGLLALALFRRRKSEPGEDVVEVSESLFSWALLRADLRSFVRWLLSRFRRRRFAPPPAPVPPIASSQADDDGRLLTVREIYQGLQWEGAEAGVPRREPETPFEYRGRLAKRLQGLAPLPNAGAGSAKAGGAAPDLDELTEAYVEARYGESATPEARLRPLNRLWRRLRAALRGATGDPSQTSE